MATAQNPEQEQAAGTGVATRPRRELAPDVQAKVDEVKARNQMVAAIRGTQWGNNLAQETQRAVAEYCRQNNLDPVRHVEILGGRIYLTAELYDEKGAALIRAGIILPDEPDYVQVDPRLEALAKTGDEWAAKEEMRRLRLRIQYAVPEAAKAAVIQRFVIAQSGATVVGVNWCGGVRPKTSSGKDADPIGEAEPAKTAQTRARRRAWKQIADIIPGYAEVVKPLEASARIVSETMPIAEVPAPHHAKALNAGPTDDPYDLGTTTRAAEGARISDDDGGLGL